MRLIVFDMDGTLIDTHALINEHMGAAFLDVGLDAPTAEASRRIIGLSLPVAIGRLAATDDTMLIDTLVDRYKSRYRESLLIADDREPLFPGAMDALNRLRMTPETLLGIATGKGLAGVTRILALHGISDHFVTLQTPDHNPSKPHPGMLLSAMAATGALPQETVMVGDTSYDMELGKAAGTRTIGVAWGYHDIADLLSAGADVLISDYSELDGAIDKVLGNA